MSEHALYSADGAHGPGHYSPTFLGCTATLHALYQVENVWGKASVESHATPDKKMVRN